MEYWSNASTCMVLHIPGQASAGVCMQQFYLPHRAYRNVLAVLSDGSCTGSHSCSRLQVRERLCKGARTGDQQQSKRCKKHSHGSMGRHGVQLLAPCTRSALDFGLEVEECKAGIESTQLPCAASFP